MLPKDEQYTRATPGETFNQKINLPPLVRRNLMKFKLVEKKKEDPYVQAKSLFDKGELNPDDWNEIEAIDNQINADLVAKISKVKDPYIKKIRQSWDSNQITGVEANELLNNYKMRRLSQKATEVLAGVEQSFLEQLDELAILDDIDRQNLEFILKIVSSDMTVKEQLLGVVSLIEQRDVQIILFLLIIEPSLVIDILENLSGAISKLVLKIFIKLVKYIIKKIKSALSIW